MDGQKDSTSIREVIHKKSNQKKQKVKGQLPNGLLDNRTIGEGSTQKPTSQEVIEPYADVQSDKGVNVPQTRNQRINFEIDEFLYGLELEGLIQTQYVAWYAKACHNLGISTVNRLAINARNGKEPTKLFAYKVKGALTTHFKRQFEQLD